MRYLRTFAVTVKITGAGLPEFAGFAQEILERIYSGTDEVNGFAAHLDEPARRKSKVALTLRHRHPPRAIPKPFPPWPGALQDDARKIAEHRQNLAAIARDVCAIARGVQSKVASTLSALQIGDITRQRIEHVQSTFALLDEFLGSEDGRKLDADARERLENVIHHLTAAQMNDMCTRFPPGFAECRKDHRELRPRYAGDPAAARPDERRRPGQFHARTGIERLRRPRDRQAGRRRRPGRPIRSASRRSAPPPSSWSRSATSVRSRPTSITWR